MVLKRPSADEESYGIPCKYSRQLDYNIQLTSIDEMALLKDVHQIPILGYEYQEEMVRTQIEQRCANENVAETFGDANKKYDPPADEPLVSSSFDLKVLPSEVHTCSDEDLDSHSSEDDFIYAAEAGSHFSSATHLNTLPRKLVLLGPDHQADLPLCSMNHEKSTKKKMVGTCILPMPDINANIFNGKKVGKCRTECNCLDEGSVRCVKQHILEEREKFKVIIGQECFVELGFSDMGEEVARKWTEEEEHVFHEVIRHNPASSGRNFWQKLSVDLPSRTRPEIVSYYFNVFMLRRREEQNRSISLRIDSDDDMIESSDEECETSEDEEQVESSVVKSQIGHESFRGVYCYEEHFHKDYYRVLHDWSFYTELNHLKGPSKSNGDEDEVQDDSCTSYEGQAAGETAKGCQNQAGKHIYDMGSCDMDKVWDVPYLAGPKFDLDLVPTSNMMKEVFGDNDEDIID